MSRHLNQRLNVLSNILKITSRPSAWLDFEWIEPVHGGFDGETCNRNGCNGIIVEGEGDFEDSGCCCHISPPCSFCTTPREYCDTCDWDAEEAAFGK